MALLNETLPRLLAWLRKAEQADNVWRATSRHIDFRHLERRLVVKEWQPRTG